MKIVIAVALTALSLLAQAQDSEKIVNIKKIIDLTGGEAAANQIFDQIAQNLKSSGGPGSDRMLAEFRKQFDLKKFNEIAIRAYDKNLSAQDVKGILAFYQSPVGKRMIAAMPNVMNDMMVETLQMTREMTEKIRKSLQEEKP
jgi:hypothetical protein